MSKEQTKKNVSVSLEERFIEALNKQLTTENQVASALEELVKWNKVTSHAEVGDILNQQVHSLVQKIVYANSDGVKTTKELSELSGMDPANISRDWKQWTQVGIAEQVSARGGSRGRSLFLLEEFGIEVPKLKPAKKTVEKIVTNNKEETDELQAK
jgi:predicted transcriptional regulator